jgi:hypothetical protein
MSSGGAIGISRKRVPIAAKIALPTVGARPTMPVSPAPAEGRSLRSISTTSIGGVSLNRGTRYCAKMRIQNTAVGKQDRFEERTTDHLFEDNNARLATSSLICLPYFAISRPSSIPSRRSARSAPPTRFASESACPFGFPLNCGSVPPSSLMRSAQKIGVTLLSHRQSSHRIPTMRVRFTFRESSIGVEALHFRLPVRLQGNEDVFVVGSCHAIPHAGRGILGIVLSFQNKLPTSWGLFLFRVPRVDIEVA